MEELDGYGYLALDPQQDGSCPCARFTFEGGRYRTHCWRVCARCEYVGVHYDPATGNRETAEQIARAMTALHWYGEYVVAEGLY